VAGPGGKIAAKGRVFAVCRELGGRAAGPEPEHRKSVQMNGRSQERPEDPAAVDRAPVDEALEHGEAERSEVLSFGDFELRPESGELRHRGEPVHLQQQPALVLELLVRRAGGTVSREEIREQVWGRETFVDSEQGINYCVRQIRVALGDSAAEPRFVETIPRRGYRFVAPVERRTETAPSVPSAAAPAAPLGGAPAAARARPGVVRRRLVSAALAVVVGLVAVAAGVWLVEARFAPEPPTAAPVVRPVIVPEEAHFRYLKARHLLDQIDTEDPVDSATEAIELLRAALEEAPEYAPARAALAGAWLYRLDVPRAEAFAKAEEHARAALALDPSLAEAQTVLATALLFLHFDWSGAADHLERALVLAPNDIDATFLRAVMLSARGHHEEAIAMARHAIELDPGHLPDVSLGWFYFCARRFDEAIREAERILEIAPLDQPNHQVLLLAALASGDEERADREMRRFVAERFIARRKAAGNPPPTEAQRAELMADVPGAREMYRSWWKRFDEERDLIGQGMDPTMPAEMALLSGDPAAAIHYLSWGCTERAASWDLPFVAVDPRWDPLRDDPRFQEVLLCVGVAEKEPELPSLRRLLD